MGFSIFLSYRRSDTSGYAHALHKSLSEHFQREEIFMDVDAIEPGVDFVEVIESSVASCSVFLALIGPRWLAQDGQSRKIDDPLDFVRLEVAAALDRRIRLIPILVDNATMPAPLDLPEPLRLLARRQALEIGNTRFSTDVSRLVNLLKRLQSQEEPAAAGPAALSGAPTQVQSSSPQPGIDSRERDRDLEIVRESRHQIESIDRQIEEDHAKTKACLAELQIARDATARMHEAAERILRHKPNAGAGRFESDPGVRYRKSGEKRRSFYKEAHGVLRREIEDLDSEIDGVLVMTKERLGVLQSAGKVARVEAETERLLSLAKENLSKLQDSKLAAYLVYDGICRLLRIPNDVDFPGGESRRRL